MGLGQSSARGDTGADNGGGNGESDNSFVAHHHSSSPSCSHNRINGHCRIWIGVTSPSFVYPELNEEENLKLTQKLNYGIALSGGGCRALTYSIGTLRGLHLLNLLTNARYISTNSGSSWLNGPLGYSSHDNITEFLGEYLPPEKCTRKNLKKIDNKSHAFFLCDGHNLSSFLKELKESILHQDGDDPRGFWSQAIGHIFFRRYNLNHFDHLPVLKGSNQDLIESETGYLKDKMTPFNPARYPYPIINGSVVVQGREISAPLEFTPLYYGIPGFFKYEGKDSTFPVGGYLLEPFGFTSTPSKEQCTTIKHMLETTITTESVEGNNPCNHIMAPYEKIMTTPAKFTAEVRQPTHIISVSEQAGISSSAMAQVVAHSIDTAQGKKLHMTVQPLWNPLTGEIHELIMSDGLGGDNTAIHSLLRRKVEKICAMFAINLSIMEPVDHRNMNQSGFADIAALFGVMTCDHMTIDGVLPEDFNKYRHVFPREDFDVLFDGLRSRCREGKPCSFLLHTHALANPLIGVPGGHPVDLLIILCHESNDWMHALPKRTNQLLSGNPTDDSYTPESLPEDTLEDLSLDMENLYENKTILEHVEEIFKDVGENLQEIRNIFRQVFRRSDLRDFPYPITESMDYSPELVNLLTNLMTWEVLESRELFEELLNIPVTQPPNCFIEK